jgi:hypothetical protein
VKLETEDPHQHSGHKNESKEPFQCRNNWMISAADPYAFVSDLFQIAEAFERRGLCFIPGHVLPAKLFSQQIEMKLQFFVDIALSLPMVQSSK